MKEVVTRLLLAYRRELELYRDVLRLAREGAECARHGRPLGELHAVNERKRTLLEEVEAIEGTIAADKASWCSDLADTDGARDLERILAQITDCIGEILRSEREACCSVVAGSTPAAALQSTEG